MQPMTPVITGVAAICALGHHLESIVRQLHCPPNCFTPPAFSSDFFQHRRIAAVPDFDVSHFIGADRSMRYMSREAQLATAALRLCIADAGVVIDDTYDADSVALFAGTGCSGINLSAIDKLLLNACNPTSGEFDVHQFGAKALYKLNPLTSFQILPNMPPAVAAIHGNIKGKNLIFNPWEGNALSALGEGLWEIRAGNSPLVFCGGSDCKTHSNSFITFKEFGLLEDNTRVLSEGSAYLALEPYEAARRRGAHIRATLSGFQQGSRPTLSYHTGCSAAFMKALIIQTLAESRIAADGIDLILSSNDFNPATDETENHVLDYLFPACPRLAPKTVLGNTFAAAGFIHLALAVSLLNTTDRQTERNIRRILVTAFAPGSEQFCMIVEKP